MIYEFTDTLNKKYPNLFWYMFVPAEETLKVYKANSEDYVPLSYPAIADNPEWCLSTIEYVFTEYIQKGE
jgi:hypothetical protein